MEAIYKLRRQIDGMAQVTERLRPIQGFETVASTGQVKAKVAVMEVHGVSYQHNSQEINVAAQYLWLAKAWLGKLLADLGTENPYAKEDGNRHSVENITPTADRVEDIGSWEMKMEWNKKNHIEKVDFIRQKIQANIESMIDFPPLVDTNTDKVLDIKLSREGAIARTNVYTYLENAKMYLGFELARVKKASQHEAGITDRGITATGNRI